MQSWLGTYRRIQLPPGISVRDGPSHEYAALSATSSVQAILIHLCMSHCMHNISQGGACPASTPPWMPEGWNEQHCCYEIGQRLVNLETSSSVHMLWHACHWPWRENSILCNHQVCDLDSILHTCHHHSYYRHGVYSLSGLQKYGWEAHDGHSFGRQELWDTDLHLTTSWVSDQTKSAISHFSSYAPENLFLNYPKKTHWFSYAK